MKKKFVGLVMLVMMFVVFGDIKAARAKEEYIDMELGKTYDGDDKCRFILKEPSKITINVDLYGQDYFVLYKINEETGQEVQVAVQTEEEERTISLAEGIYYWRERFGSSASEIIMTSCITSNPDIEEVESNDSFDDAQEITTGIKYSGDYSTNADYYKFVLDAPGSVYVEVWNEAFKRSHDDQFILYWEDQDLNTHDITKIVQGENGYAKSNQFRFPAGVYYLVFKRFEYARTYEYSFKVNYEAESKEQYETEDYTLEDGKQNVNEILTNKEYIGNIQTENDVDFYAFKVEDSSRIQLKFTQPRGTAKGTFYVILFSIDENGEKSVLDEIETTTNPVYRGKELVLPSGIYYIQVGGNEYDLYGERSHIDYSVSVAEETTKLIKEIVLKTSKKSFYSGMTFTLKATLTPKNPTDASITWSSSDTDIATVDKKGKVTCLKPGKCYIYAKANDGGGAIGKYLLTVVKSSVNTLSKVTISAGSISPEFGKSETSYTITLPKEIAKVTIKWARTSKYSIAAVDGKSSSKTTVSVQQGKSKTVKVVVTAENGKTKTYKFTVKREK